MRKTHHRACNLCEAMCGLVIDTEADRVVRIRPDASDPLSRGHICPKAFALQDLEEDPDRLVRPLRRTPAGDFEEIDWDTAFREVGAALGRVRTTWGRHAVGVYQGNPTVHALGAMTIGQLFWARLRTRNHFSATSADQLPHMLAAYEMFGHQLFMPVPDLDRADLVVLLGANPKVSGGSIMSAPGFADRVRAMQSRGGALVIVDPVRTKTAALADSHLAIRPGTDPWLLLSILHVLFADNRVQRGRLASVMRGLDDIAALARDFSPETTARITGVDADVVRDLAQRLADTERAVVHGRFGACTQPYGSVTGWLLVVVNALTRHLDEPGGLMFANPALDVVGLSARAGKRGSFDRYRSRVRDLPEFGGELPVACLAEEIATPGDGQLKALITHAGNPVLSAPEGKALEDALPKLELMVSIDFFLNETTRHAHYILPPTPPLQRPHYDVIFHALAVRDTARYAPPVLERPAEARHDHEIFWALTRALEGPNALPAWARAATRLGARALSPPRLIDLLLRLSPRRLSLRKIQKSQSSYDLGHPTPQLPGRLFTKDRTIPLAPPRLVEAARSMTPPDANGLVLVGRRELRSNNSWMHNAPSLQTGKPTCTLWVHPDDAAAASLTEGADAVLSGPAGEITLPVEVTTAVARGVVCAPHGFGHTRPGTRLRVAQSRPGASVNDVTSNQRLDALTGNAAFSGTPVQVRPADA